MKQSEKLPIFPWCSVCLQNHPISQKCTQNISNSDLKLSEVKDE
jgi:hypothetical protein